MTIQLFSRPETRRRRFVAPRLRPGLEDLESRTVLNAAAVAPHIAVPAQVAAKPQVTVSVPLSITGINLTSLTRDAQGVLTATGTLTGSLLGHTFTTPLTATVTPASGTQTCPVLHLALNPIHLNLLGLKVDTSAICLNVDATSGPGNLLGNLLCGGPTTGLTGVLNQATTSLTGALTSLNGVLNNTQLLGGLNNVLSQATSAAGSPTAATNILNLSVGPVDLNLLGLGVHLDNCANGPVTVSISAQPGAGNLLGNLLSSVAHLLDVPGNPTGAITGQINTILNLARIL